MQPSVRLPRRLVATVAVLAFALMVGLIARRAVRVYHEPGPAPDGFGLIDFHNAIYFPGKAFAAGENPYSAEYAAKYPVNRALPPYSPLLLVLALPFGLLPIHVGDVSWFACNTMLTVVLAAVCLRMNRLPLTIATVFGLAAAILATRAGHSNLILGQVTLPMVLAVYLALAFADQSLWRSALGVALATIKPTFGLPLAGLMLCRGQWRPVVLGAILAVLATAPAVAWMSAGSGFSLHSLQASRDAHVADSDVDPESAWMRVDTLNGLARLSPGWLANSSELVPLFIHVLVVGVFLWRFGAVRDETSAAMTVSAAIVCLTILVSVYHMIYDALIVVPFVVAGLMRYLPAWRAMPRWFSVGVALLLWAVLMNYVATYSILERLAITGVARDVCVSLNGLLLLAALLLLMIYQWRTHEPSGAQETLSPTADLKLTARCSLRTLWLRA